MATNGQTLSASDAIAQLAHLASARGMTVDDLVKQVQPARSLKPAAPRQPAHVPTAATGKLTAPAKSDAARRASKSICGAKSPNGPCQKCNGPFNPVMHFTLDRLKALDGGNGDISQDWDGRAFLGISVDDKYFGNVVLVGFGRDTINLRPKTFLRLAHALEAYKASDHVAAVLPDSMILDE